MGDSAIEWTDKTWNPTTGCTRVSEGCRNCYAFALHDQRHAAHLAGKKVPAQYAKPFKELQLFPDRLADPLSWRKPCRVFVNSMSDLFHEDVPDDFIDRVFAVMAFCGRHTFQVLTKRAERMRDYMVRLARSIVPLENAARGMGLTFKFNDGVREWPLLPWPVPNVWLGVSVEDQKRADERIPLLLQTPAAVRFLSCEPLLEAVSLEPWTSYWFRTATNRPLHWVIIGGESGPGARNFNAKWARSLIRECRDRQIPVFVKQLGSAPFDTDAECPPGSDRRFTIAGAVSPAGLAVFADCLEAMTLRLRDRKGGDMCEWPPDLRVREFPGPAKVES